MEKTTKYPTVREIGEMARGVATSESHEATSLTTLRIGLEALGTVAGSISLADASEV